MRRVMVRYTVKPGQEAVNEKLARAVYDELHQTQPAGLQYATFRLDDGRTFVHVAFDETPARPPRAVHPLHRARHGHRDHRQHHRPAGCARARSSAA